MKKQIIMALSFAIICALANLVSMWMDFAVGPRGSAPFVIAAAFSASALGALVNLRKNIDGDATVLSFLSEFKLMSSCAALALGLIAEAVQLVLFFFPQGATSAAPAIGGTALDIPCAIIVAISSAAAIVLLAIRLVACLRSKES